MPLLSVQKVQLYEFLSVAQKPQVLLCTIHFFFASQFFYTVFSFPTRLLPNYLNISFFSLMSFRVSFCFFFLPSLPYGTTPVLLPYYSRTPTVPLPRAFAPASSQGERHRGNLVAVDLLCQSGPARGLLYHESHPGNAVRVSTKVLVHLKGEAGFMTCPH